MRAVFDARGYGEVATPALEYEEVLTRGDTAAADPAYRLFDEHGNVLVLRSDMTIPIARVVATRYPSAPVPLRFFYLQHAYRAVRQHRGQPREILQAGIELVGAPGPDGHGRGDLRAVRGAGRRRAGLLPRRASATRRCSRARSSAPACPTDARPQILHELRHARPRRARARAARASAPPSCSTSRARAAASRCSTASRRPSRCARSTAASPTTCATRVIFDLGLVRTLGYYTGAVFEVYDAAFGVADRRRRALRRPARALRPRAAGLRLGAGRRARARRAAGRRAR